MNILLIYPPNTHQAVYSRNFRRLKGSETSAYPPLGLMYLQAMIKRETAHNVKIIDLTVPSADRIDLAKVVRDFAPQIVGITAYTLCFYDVLQTARLIRAIDANIKVVIGGPHVDLYPLESLGHSEIDFAVVGDGEIPFLALMGALENSGDLSGIPSLYYRDPQGKVCVTPRLKPDRSLESLPIPCRKDLNEDDYYNPFFSEKRFATISTSRGCPFQCTFCDVADKYFRSRSISNVLDEIEALHKDQGIGSFFIVDDLFNITPDRCLDFCRGLKERGLKIKWIFRGRIDQVNEEVLRECFLTGCVHVIYGVEDFTDEGLKAIKKHITLEQAVRVFEMTRKQGVKTTANFIIGFPHHRTDEDIRKLPELLKTLRPDYLQVGILIPFPGSPIFKDGVNRGIIDPQKWLAYVKNPMAVFEMPLWEEHLSLSSLTAHYEKIMRGFYLSPNQLFKRLREIDSWHRLVSYLKVGLATFRMGKKYDA
ncbi:MAG: radical SAM protein [Candidatus Omnitrophota bacterium]